MRTTYILWKGYENERKKIGMPSIRALKTVHSSWFKWLSECVNDVRRDTQYVIFARNQRHTMDYIHAILLGVYLINIFWHTRHTHTQPNGQRKNGRNCRRQTTTHELFCGGTKKCRRVSSFYFIFDLSNNFICFWSCNDVRYTYSYVVRARMNDSWWEWMRLIPIQHECLMFRDCLTVAVQIFVVVVSQILSLLLDGKGAAAWRWWVVIYSANTIPICIYQSGWHAIVRNDERAKWVRIDFIILLLLFICIKRGAASRA